MFASIESDLSVRIGAYSLFLKQVATDFVGPIRWVLFATHFLAFVGLLRTSTLHNMAMELEVLHPPGGQASKPFGLAMPVT